MFYACPSAIDRQSSGTDSFAPAVVAAVRNPDADRPRPVAPAVAHYVIVRADLPHGAQLAQVCHAAGESVEIGTKPGTIAVALHARDESHLLELADALDRAGLQNHRVLEDDGSLQAVGLRPTRDRAAVRKVLSALPLAR